MTHYCLKCGCLLIRHPRTDILKCISCGHINEVKDLHGTIRVKDKVMGNQDEI